MKNKESLRNLSMVLRQMGKGEWFFMCAQNMQCIYVCDFNHTRTNLLYRCTRKENKSEGECG